MMYAKIAEPSLNEKEDIYNRKKAKCCGTELNRY